MADEVALYDKFNEYDVMVDWNQRLEREWAFFGTVLARAPSAGPRQRLLDVGCGTGWHARRFAESGREVVAADPSAEMLRRAAHNHRGVANLSFARAGFGELRDKVGSGFDAVTCLGNTLPHALDRDTLQRALEDIASVLQPGGLLVVQQLSYDRICATRQRFLGLTPARAGGDELLFFRFYDYAGDLLVFNVVTFRRSEGGEWTFSADHTSLRPIVRAELDELLPPAGFARVEYYGGYDMKPFQPDTSNDLVLVATKAQ